MADNKRVISARQIRAARALLGWSQAALAEAAGLSLAALNNAERGVTDPRKSTIDKIEAALKKGGVQFIAENGGGPGVRLRQGLR